MFGVVAFLSACGPELEIPPRPYSYDAYARDASTPDAGQVDAGPVRDPDLEACRAICPEGSTVSLAANGACVCGR